MVAFSVCFSLTNAVKLVFVTCGADCCFYQNAVAKGHVPSLSGIKVVDTTGAGDIFGAVPSGSFYSTAKPRRNFKRAGSECG